MCHRPELTTSIQSRTESFANGHESIEILRVFIFDGFKIENEKLRLLKIQTPRSPHLLITSKTSSFL
jgi:hypothetical protein